MVELQFWESLDTERRILLTLTYTLLLVTALILVYMDLIFAITFEQEQNIVWISSVFIGVFSGE